MLILVDVCSISFFNLITWGLLSISLFSFSICTCLLISVSSSDISFLIEVDFMMMLFFFSFNEVINLLMSSSVYKLSSWMHEIPSIFERFLISSLFSLSLIYKLLRKFLISYIELLNFLIYLRNIILFSF